MYNSNLSMKFEYEREELQKVKETDVLSTSFVLSLCYSSTFRKDFEGVTRKDFCYTHEIQIDYHWNLESKWFSRIFLGCFSGTSTIPCCAMGSPSIGWWKAQAKLENSMSLLSAYMFKWSMPCHVQSHQEAVLARYEGTCGSLLPALGVSHLILWSTIWLDSSVREENCPLSTININKIS